MAKRKKKTTRTPEQEARWERTTKLVEERMAYHSEMSRLLREREREQARLEELRRAAGER
ncbi:hypothetical protein [Gaiella sp.]|jgi:hypothetical protein|uniref:hypothetical protein n=1 Tax=Gaiella sp. TaxID=2663207 RepID=UPI002E3542BC|nr:hypothetical protein [Gaiella sp.]HEX5582689.1 hypothetical protein [Gaiella sp.]